MPKKVKQNTEARSITAAQRNLMLEFIKNHPKMISGQFAPNFTIKDAQKLWEELAKLLNVLQGPEKDWKKWRKCYQDWKTNVKNNKASQNKSRGATGGGPPEQVAQNTDDDKLAEIIDPVLINGLEDIAESEVEFDFPEDNKDEEQKIDAPEVAPDEGDNKKSQLIDILKTATDEGKAEEQDIDDLKIPGDEEIEEQKTDVLKTAIDEEEGGEYKADGLKTVSDGEGYEEQKTACEDTLSQIFGLKVQAIEVENEFSSAIYSDFQDDKTSIVFNPQYSNSTVISQSNTTQGKDTEGIMLLNVEDGDKENDKNIVNKPKVEFKEEKLDKKGIKKSSIRARSNPGRRLESAIATSNGMTSIMSSDLSLKSTFYKRKTELRTYHQRKIEILEENQRLKARKTRALEKIGEAIANYIF